MKDKIKFIKEIAASMNDNKIDKIKYEDHSFEVEINKKHRKITPPVLGYPAGAGFGANVAAGNPVGTQAVGDAVVSPAVEEKVSAEVEIAGTKIESPMVGTFYASPSPGADPFVKVGDMVSEGQTLCIVEAMKLMNEVKSSVSGKVVKIMAKNGEIIKKGQTLVVIE